MFQDSTLKQPQLCCFLANTMSGKTIYSRYAADLETMPEVRFEVDSKKQLNIISIEPEIAEKLMEIARARQTTSVHLVNLWLKEKISVQT